MKLLGYLKGDGMRARAIRSSGFTFLKLGGHNILRLASNLILTRLLFPEAFGIMALVQVVLSGVTMFSDFGIRGSIIQDKRGTDPNFLNTAWTVQIVRGLLLGLIVLFAARAISEFYETPLLRELLLVSAAVPVIQGFASTRLASASRELYIGRMVGLQLGAQFVAIIVTIFLAWWLETVWALVFGALVGPALVTILSHVVIPGIRNRPRFDIDALKRLFAFGKYIYLGTIAGFFVNQGDKVVLGKFISLGELAIYNIALFLASVPILLGQSLLGSVVFPLYARRPPWESRENRRKIQRSRFFMTGVLLSGLLVLALIGEVLVTVLFDERYHGAGPLVIVIALSAMPRIILQSYPTLPLAYGHSGRFASLNIALAVSQLALVFLGAKFAGVIGAAVAPALSYLLYYPFLVVMVRRYQGWDVAHDVFYFAVALGIAATVFTFNRETLLMVLSTLLG